MLSKQNNSQEESARGHELLEKAGLEPPEPPSYLHQGFYNEKENIFSLFTHSFLYCVGLTDGSLGGGNAAGDATVALTHAPQFTADFLRVSVEGE